MRSHATVGSPPVTLQNGTAGTSTIYTNNTSAKASVESPLFDYVDNNDPDVDSSADKGMHSNFPAQQASPDSLYDTLAEENTEAIEDYVDNNTSDVDSSSDVGSHSNFENQKDHDSIYDTLTEQNTGVITKVGTDISGTGTSLTLSFSHTLVSGAARIVIVSIGVENGDTIDVSTVTYGGVTMTLAVERITGTSGFRCLNEIWYLLENDLPSDGSQTVEINCSGTAYELEVNGFCSEYTGVTQGAPEATDGASQISGNTISNTISPSDGAWVISIAGSGNAGSFTHGQGQVEVLDFQDASSTFAVAELRGASGETSLSSTYSGTVNRLCRVAASWTEAIEDDSYELDLEIQFTAVIDFLPTEMLCINTGTFSGTEDINVDFWNGSGWENLATDLNAYSCSEYTVSLTSVNFTIRFKGGTESSDTTQDQWQIDTSLLRVEGAGSKEDAVDQQSNVDGSADIGTHSNFTAEQYGPDSIYDTLTEANTTNYELDLEVKWTDVHYSLPNETLCIYGGTMEAEDIKVDVWNGTGWENVFTDLSSGWNNVSITNWLTTSNLTIRFKGGNETGDSSQDTWQIDVALVHVWHDGGESYELDLEIQWTNTDYTRTNEELCIKAGTFSGSENIQVEVWNSTGSSWNWVMNLTANQWNNASIASYLTSNTLTVQFLGGTETGDTTQDSWNIDATFLHVWTIESTYDYVLRVNNTVTDSWEIRLKEYSNSSVGRLQNCTIYFHNSTDGNSAQIIVENGSFKNETGSWYNLGSSQTIYIAITVEASSTGTSYIYTYLEVRAPNTTTYARHIITFEIT